MTEEYAKSFLGSAGLGLAAGWLLGPIGLAAGLLIGGLKKKVTFLLRLRDGRQFLGLTDEETYNLMATAFASRSRLQRGFAQIMHEIEDARDQFCFKHVI